MEPCTEYRIKAAELFALANNDHYHGVKIQCERLARAYLRLAEQAERNSHLDLTYKTPLAKSVESRSELETLLSAQGGTRPVKCKGLGAGEPR